MINVLAFGAHPDDCELTMGGTLALLKKNGYKTGVCDLSRGESGTYGSEAIRVEEKEKAGSILSLDARITLDIPDGRIWNTEGNRVKIIEVIRRFRPQIVFSFVADTRHPDHRHTGELVLECIFLAGLEKIATESAPFRPAAFIRFPELFPWHKPDFVVDISDVWEIKMAAIKAYASQFGDGSETPQEPPLTFLKSNEFLELIEAKCRLAGGMIGAKYGEPFYTHRPLRVTDPFLVAPKEFR
jgi:bacillithiol biosynthesis deacetylase BshB1